jgi:GMP synthase (glutamine-hydrolysing)
MRHDSRPRIAVVRNSVEGLGSLSEPLSEGAQLTLTRADRDASLPTPDEFDALVVLGGPASAYDATRTIRAEVELIRQTLNAEKPYLGICLGAQLLAKACDAAVYPATAGEYGVGTVRLTADAANDPLFTAAARSGTISVFQWHGDTFDLPDGATRLAEGDVCVNQAFRVGRAWGVQFHVETDADTLWDWLYGDEHAGYDADVERRALDRDALLATLRSVENEQRTLAVAMATAFRALIGD